jgi:hypothetical protein
MNSVELVLTASVGSRVKDLRTDDKRSQLADTDWVASGVTGVTAKPTALIGLTPLAELTGVAVTPFGPKVRPTPDRLTSRACFSRSSSWFSLIDEPWLLESFLVRTRVSREFSFNNYTIIANIDKCLHRLWTKR